MRQAEIDQAWKRNREKRPGSLTVEKLIFRFDALSKSITKEFLVPGRVCALLGENGSRKTAILRSLFSVSPKTGELPTWQVRLHGVELSFRKISLTILKSGTTENDDSENKTVPDVVYVDSSSDVHEITTRLLRQDNLEELVEQHESKQLTDAEMGPYCFVLGREYSQIKIREIELAALGDEVPNSDFEDADGEIIYPFFEVAYADGFTYDSRNMGFGELSAFLLIWKLARAQKGTLFLIDEPDSHLSAASRGAVADYFAWIADKQQHWILFSSHSLEPVQRLTEHEMLVITRPEYGLTNNPSFSSDKRSVMLKLGFTLSRKFLFVVEDVDALEVLTKVMGKWLPDLAPSCDIRKMLGGAEAIQSLSSYFPDDTPVCILTIVLDGDKRGLQDKRIAFLPGTTDPMDQVRNWSLANSGLVAASMDVGEGVLTNALKAAAAVDSHDFCREVSRRLALPQFDVPRVRQGLVAAWLRDEAVKASFGELTGRLREIIEKSPLSI